MARKVNRGPRPNKPYPEFPLFPHLGGVWAKVIRGETKYFGPWSDPDGALKKYLHDRDWLYAGEVPPTTDGLTMDELLNRFLVAQEGRVECREITSRHWQDLKRDCQMVLDFWGSERPVSSLRPMDFDSLRAKIMTGRSATTATTMIARVKSVFHWAVNWQLIAAKPNWGQSFRKPSAAMCRRALAERADNRQLEAVEVRRLINASQGNVNVRAAILLGINCGLGNADCSVLSEEHLDLAAGVMKFPRPKTGIERRAVLWPETVAAIKLALARRDRIEGVPEDLQGRVFVTRNALAYCRLSARGGNQDGFGSMVRKLLINTDAYKPGRGFYSLRHTFQTVAEDTKDFPAIDLVMGHIAGAEDMAARYRGTIPLERLKAVSDCVHRWLFNKPGGRAAKKK